MRKYWFFLLLIVFLLASCVRVPPFPEAPVGQANEYITEGVVMSPSSITSDYLGSISFSVQLDSDVWAVYRSIYINVQDSGASVSNDFPQQTNDWTVIASGFDNVAGTISQEQLRIAANDLTLGTYRVIVMAYKLVGNYWDANTVYYFQALLEVTGLASECEDGYSVCDDEDVVYRIYCDSGSLASEQCGWFCYDGICIDAPGGAPTCDDDDDCQSGYECSDGICVPEEVETVLITDEQNPSNMVFTSGDTACQSVDKDCTLLEVSCHNLAGGDPTWQVSSVNHCSDTSFSTLCVYRAVCVGGSVPEYCDDGLDNDGDGDIDYSDSECTCPADSNQYIDSCYECTVSMTTANADESIDFTLTRVGGTDLPQPDNPPNAAFYKNSDPPSTASTHFTSGPWTTSASYSAIGTYTADFKDNGAYDVLATCPTITVGSTEDCTTEGDEDGDGAADCADPDCAGQPGPSESQCCQVIGDCSDYWIIGYECYFGIEPYTCDVDVNKCRYYSDLDENKVCGLSECTENGWDNSACSDEVCDDGSDNNGDGAADCADSECYGELGPNGVPCCQDVQTDCPNPFVNGDTCSSHVEGCDAHECLYVDDDSSKECDASVCEVDGWNNQPCCQPIDCSNRCGGDDDCGGTCDNYCLEQPYLGLGVTQCSPYDDVTCVQCTSDGHCSYGICDTRPGMNQYSCVDLECINDDQCVDGVCDTDTNTCVGCLSINDCSNLQICTDNVCEDVECTSNAHCSDPNPVCDPTTNICVECVLNNQCPPSTPVCTGGNTCVECESDADCSSSNPYCSAFECVACTSNVQCEGHDGDDICGCYNGDPPPYCCLPDVHCIECSPM
ncbi:hypothetical protein HQ533_00770 [Candidatus Woesearchaeota archaeon]|nr:hypothetical protein [Candidatus Woesearchaeota archaeon]